MCLTSEILAKSGTFFLDHEFVFIGWRGRGGGKRGKNKKRGIYQAELPCTWRKYCVQSDLDLQHLTLALENVSFFWLCRSSGKTHYYCKKTHTHTHSHTDRHVLISMKSEVTRLSLYLANIILSCLHNCLVFFVWISIHIDTLCMH